MRVTTKTLSIITFITLFLNAVIATPIPDPKKSIDAKDPGTSHDEVKDKSENTLKGEGGEKESNKDGQIKRGQKQGNSKRQEESSEQESKNNPEEGKKKEKKSGDREAKTNKRHKKKGHKQDEDEKQDSKGGESQENEKDKGTDADSENRNNRTSNSSAATNGEKKVNTTDNQTKEKGQLTSAQQKGLIIGATALGVGGVLGLTGLVGYKMVHSELEGSFANGKTSAPPTIMFDSLNLSGIQHSSMKQTDHQIQGKQKPINKWPDPKKVQQMGKQMQTAHLEDTNKLKHTVETNAEENILRGEIKHKVEEQTQQNQKISQENNVIHMIVHHHHFIQRDPAPQNKQQLRPNSLPSLRPQQGHQQPYHQAHPHHWDNHNSFHPHHPNIFMNYPPHSHIPPLTYYPAHSSFAPVNEPINHHPLHTLPFKQAQGIHAQSFPQYLHHFIPSYLLKPLGQYPYGPAARFHPHNYIDDFHAANRHPHMTTLNAPQIPSQQKQHQRHPAITSHSYTPPDTNGAGTPPQHLRASFLTPQAITVNTQTPKIPLHAKSQLVSVHVPSVPNSAQEVGSPHKGYSLYPSLEQFKSHVPLRRQPQPQKPQSPSITQLQVSVHQKSNQSPQPLQQSHLQSLHSSKYQQQTQAQQQAYQPQSPQSQTKSQSHPQSHPQSQPQSQPQSESHPQTQPQTHPQLQPQTQPQLQPQTQSQPPLPRPRSIFLIQPPPRRHESKHFGNAVKSPAYKWP